MCIIIMEHGFIIYFHAKATGEPAVCMSNSVMFAIRNAISSARKDAGLPDEWFRFGK